MTPLFLPIPPPDLARIIREEWAEAARQQTTPGSTILAGLGADVLEDGTIVFTLDGRQWVTATGSPAALRALLSLADALEDRGLVVDREGGGIRVVGWAAARVTDPEILIRYRVSGVLGPDGDVVSVEQLYQTFEPWAVPQEAQDWRDGVLRARLARAEAGRAGAGEPGTMGKGEMKVRRMRG